MPSTFSHNESVPGFGTPMLGEAAPCYKIGNTWLSLAPARSHPDGPSDTDIHT